MERPVKFEHVRFLGDKRTQLVYDLDEWDDPAPIDDLLAADTGICFGPDTIAKRATVGTRSPDRGCTACIAGPVREP